MAGLLDALNSEQGLLGLSLLAAAAPKERRTSIGEGLLMASQNVQNMRNAQEERAARMRMQQMQEQALQMQLADRQRQQQQAEGRSRYLSRLDPNQGPPMEATPAGAMAAGLSPQEFGMLAPRSADIDKVSPKDYTPESWTQFVRTRDPAVLRAAPKDDKPPADWQLYQLSGAAQRGMTFDQWDQARRRASATNVGVSYGAPVQAIGPDGKPVFIQPTKDGSPPNIIPGVRPPMSAAEEREAADKTAKARQAQQMMTAMSDARQILQKGTATASGIGTVRDAAGRAVGVTTAGAQDAARLQALSGWLVANVPRMEGPQSNYDVQNYMLMAGKIGDSTVPIKERLSALETVEKLQRKYAEINGSPMPAPAASSPSLDDLLKKYGN